MGKDEKTVDPLAGREAELKEKEDYLNKLEEFLQDKETKLAEREEALAKAPGVPSAKAEKKPLSAAEQKLIDEGCKAYGIAKKYLLASGIDVQTHEAILVTDGGAKVRYAKGMEVEELDPVRVDGISRKKPRHVAGKKK